MTRILDSIDRPRRPPRPHRAAAAAGRPGGPRAHHRHRRGDRRPLRGEPRHVRDRGRAALADEQPAGQDPLGRRPPGPTRTRSLTGRRDQLATIRQYEGLAPFCATFESEHDIMGAGHASTSIGYGVGLGEGMRLKGEDAAGRVAAVIGDGAMTGGVAFEAVHQAGGLGTPARRRAQRQRHVDQPERRRAEQALHPRAPEPSAVARSRAGREQAHRAARHRRAGSTGWGPSSRSR